jgi:hypothetical protein
MLNLSFLDQVAYCSGDIFNGHLRVDTVLVIQDR